MMKSEIVAELFDSHCHFDFDEFGSDADRQKLWLQCGKIGIKRLLIPGVEPAQWQKVCDICKALEGVYMAVGIHPWWIENYSLPELELAIADSMESYLLKDECLAIGECGLDGVIDIGIDVQMRILKKQFELACDSKKPLILHVRKAHNEILALIKIYRPAAGGVIHGFTGSAELAMQYYKLGFCMGIGGSITYPRANKTRKMVELMPVESIVLETDAPDMPLHGHQGEANNPLNIVEVVRALANIREESVDFIAMKTTENAKRIFGL